MFRAFGRELIAFALLFAMSVSPLLGDETGDAEGDAEGSSVYSRTAPDGTLVASQDRWYLEELDALGRPVSGTVWVRGEIDERISWIYADSSQQCSIKIVTGKDGSEESEFDGSGKLVGKTVTDKEGKTVSKLSNGYNDRGLVSWTETDAAGVVSRTEFTYEGDEMREKRSYRNGILLVAYSYRDSDNWTETVYSSGQAILVVEYENGVRKPRSR